MRASLDIDQMRHLAGLNYDQSTDGHCSPNPPGISNSITTRILKEQDTSIDVVVEGQAPDATIHHRQHLLGVDGIQRDTQAC